MTILDLSDSLFPKSWCSGSICISRKIWKVAAAYGVPYCWFSENGINSWYLTSVSGAFKDLYMLSFGITANFSLAGYIRIKKSYRCFRTIFSALLTSPSIIPASGYIISAGEIRIVIVYIH